MKTQLVKRSRREHGYALVVVLIFGVTGLLILGAALRWNSQNSSMIDRNNQYFRCIAAAEAATEKVISQMSHDYQKLGPATVAAKTDFYRGLVPTVAENTVWGNYRFSDAGSGANKTYVQVTSPWSTNAAALTSQYEGLKGYGAAYRVISNAREASMNTGITGAICQDVDLRTIPLFQFMLFYNMNMEINPGPDMTVRGRVHSNGEIYAQPQATLTFNGDVTAVKTIHDLQKDPNDPLIRTIGRIIYNGEHDGGVNSLNLPLGVDNTPAAAHSIIEIPPVGELPTSQLGSQRLFNKADLIVQVTDLGVLVNRKVDLITGIPGASIAYTGVSGWVRTNVSFYNGREGKVVKTVEIDVGQLASWSGSGANPVVNTLYVVDKRSTSTSSGNQPGVRLVNGATLPNGGLTVATPNPLYVQGNYNASGVSAAVGTTDTSNTKPAALIADAITVLSTAWTRSTGISSYNSTSGTYDQRSGLTGDSMTNNRKASDTAINAAFLAGIVPTSTATGYSGGVENFPRFLENWSNKNLTYNGSMIVMFPSQVAVAPWSGTSGYYSPPIRKWNFDNNFTDPNKLPPNTPAVRTIIRGQWSIVPPNRTTGFTVSVNQ